MSQYGEGSGDPSDDESLMLDMNAAIQGLVERIGDPRTIAVDSAANDILSADDDPKRILRDLGGAVDGAFPPLYRMLAPAVMEANRFRIRNGKKAMRSGALVVFAYSVGAVLDSFLNKEQ
jgi:hypothetical protein